MQKKLTFLVKIWDIYKIENKNFIGISVLGYENNGKHPVYVSKKFYGEQNIDLLLKGEEGNSHITYFNTFMYDRTLHHGKKHFCCYCLQALSTDEILKRH